MPGRIARRGGQGQPGSPGGREHGRCGRCSTGSTWRIAGAADRSRNTDALVHTPVVGGAVERAADALLGAAGVDGDRERPGLGRQGPSHRLGAEAGRRSTSRAGVVIDIGDAAGAEGDGDPGGVQADRVGPVVAADHQDVRSGCRRPAAGRPCARHQSCCRLRWRQRRDRRRRAGARAWRRRAARERGRRAALPSAGLPSSPGRRLTAWVRRAVAGSSPPARQARAARDLERNDHQVAGSDGGTSSPTCTTSATPSCPKGYGPASG